MIAKKDRGQIYKYILMYIILFETGTPVQTKYTRTFVTGIFLVSIIILLHKQRMKYKSCAIWASVGFFMTLTCLVNQDTHFSTVIMLLMVMLSAAAFSEIYKKQEFENIYVAWMIFLAAVAMAFYVIGILFPDFVTIFPIFHAVNGDYPVVMGMFFYPCGSILYPSTLYRNNGLFREPGLFAMLLLWAICIMCQKKNKKKYTLKEIVVVIMALITTFSTTGIIALVILFPVLVKRCGAKELWKKFGNLKYIIGVMGIVVSGIIVYQNRMSLFGKLDPTHVSYGSFSIRYGGLKKDISLFAGQPWGIGPTRYSLESIGGANSISFFLACFGLVTTFIIFFGFFLFIKNMDYSRWEKLFVLGAAVLVFQTQAVSDYVIFYMLVVYGYIGQKNNGREKIGHESKENCHDQLLLQRI